MKLILWITVISMLFLKVQSYYKYVTHYAEDDCDKYKDDSVDYSLGSSGYTSSAIIKATRSLSYSYPFNCNITVSVRNSRDAQVLLKVRKISFRSSSRCKNYVMIYQGKERGYRLCTKDDVKSGKTDFTQSDNKKMKFLYHTESYSSERRISDEFFSTGFEILATAYTNAPCGKDLSFLCGNNRCISKKLVRDGYDNCGDSSDEYRVWIRIPNSTIIGIVVGVLLLIAAISCGVWLFRRERVTTSRTYTTPAQSLYPTGPQTYPQIPAPYAPYPSAPGTQNLYGDETYQKSQPYNQYGGVANPNFGQPPPPPYQ